MKYNFINNHKNTTELLSDIKGLKDDNVLPFLLESNLSSVTKILDFLNQESKLLFVSGALGTGKPKLVDFALSALVKDVVVLRYNCFNSTVLDDILLSFYLSFKKFFSANFISEPQVKSENFVQKINSYFAHIERPFLIILDSYESILEEHRKDIADFILHLSRVQKTKIIVISRTLDTKNFIETDLTNVAVNPFEKEFLEKCLKSEKLKISQAVLDEFYKYSKGYYFLTLAALKLMKNDKAQPLDFLTEFLNSYLSFADFVAKKLLTLIPSNQRNLFWLLTLTRHPLNKRLLEKMNLYDEEKIAFLKDNLLVTEGESGFYVQDYLKEKAEELIAQNIENKIRRYIVDVYLQQLPLKPMERDIGISRQTMRKEIEYQNLFLPKKAKSLEPDALDINYLSYAKLIDASSPQSLSKETEEIQKQDSGIDLTQRKNVSLNLENLPFQSKASKPVIKPKSEIIGIKNEPEQVLQSLEELLDLARQAEIKYHYSKVIELLEKALLQKSDASYERYLGNIYTRLAFAYQKNADVENALKYYKLAQNTHEIEKNTQKAEIIKYATAKILHESYKIKEAADIFKDLIQDFNVSSETKIKAYLELANIEDGASNSSLSFEYYQNAIELSKNISDIEILGELYFKYALALDDKNDYASAIEYYKKGIKLSDDYVKNKFLSASYSNIAILYQENGDISNAELNYEKAYNIDKLSQNIEGMYYSSSKLASMFNRKNPQKALFYLRASLDCANLLKDSFYIVSADLNLGDYYYDTKSNELALKFYFKALQIAKKDLSKENIEKIEQRIADIKIRLGAQNFDRVLQIIKEGEDE